MKSALLDFLFNNTVVQDKRSIFQSGWQIHVIEWKRVNLSPWQFTRHESTKTARLIQMTQKSVI